MVVAESCLGNTPLPTTLGDAEDDLVQVLPPVLELTRSRYLLTHPNMRRTHCVAALVDHITDDTPALRTALIG